MYQRHVRRAIRMLDRNADKLATRSDAVQSAQRSPLSRSLHADLIALHMFSRDCAMNRRKIQKARAVISRYYSAISAPHMDRLLHASKPVCTAPRVSLLRAGV